MCRNTFFRKGICIILKWSTVHPPNDRFNKRLSLPFSLSRSEGTLYEHSSLSPTLCLDPSFFFSPFSVCRRKIPGPAKQLILDELNANSEFQASISTSKQCLTIMPKQYLVQDLLPCQQTSCSCHVMCH